jgi:hypothetical protein
MGWSVEITGDNLPDLQERISSVCACPGNFYYCVMEMAGKQLRQMDKDEAIWALQNLIAELDKGNFGYFNDKWAVHSDSQWSDGRETLAEYAKWEHITDHPFPFDDYTSFCGWHTRDRIREDALRFFLYYKAGYNINYEW